MERVTWGRMQNPIRGLLHGSAAVATVVGVLFLLRESPNTNLAMTLGVLVFGVALFSMYVVSSLYHSIPWSAQWKERLQRLDHSMIFLVVAGTFTPVAIAALTGIRLMVALGLVWVLAVVGITLKSVLPGVRTWLSLTLQMVMGWSALIWIPNILEELGHAAVFLILAGGFCYVVGVIVFVMKRPRLWSRVFSYHELFHVLVIAGSTLHFVAILRYAIPAVA